MPVRVQRRRPLAGVIVYPLFVLAILVIALVVYTVINGELRVPFLGDGTLFAFSRQQPAELSERDYVSVPLSARVIPAYSKIGREHYWDIEAQQYTFVNLPRASVTEDIVTMADIGKMGGRVLARDKTAQMAFRWSDFLPEGTRPGLAGGVPAGLRGVWVETEKVRGLADLRAGDRFDVLATTELKVDKTTAPASVSGVYAAELQMHALQRSRAPQARVDVLVQNGVLIVPMRTREVPIASNSLMRGQRRTTIPIQEVFIAVAPGELAPLTRAIALGLDLRAGLRSGRVDESGVSLTPSVEPADEDPLKSMLGPRSDFAFVEVIEGGERARVLRRRADPESAPRSPWMEALAEWFAEWKR